MKVYICVTKRATIPLAPCTYYKQIYIMNSSLASTTASIQGWTLLQAGMMTSRQFWPLQPRSWHWWRPGCYEGVYWPLSQLRSTWNNLKDYNLLSWEARFPWTNGPSGWPSAGPGWFWLCFGWLGHRIHCPFEATWPFCVNFELGGQIFLDNGPSGWPSASPGWFWLCFGWPGHKIHCPCEAKRIFFVLILDRSGICLPSILVLI